MEITNHRSTDKIYTKSLKQAIYRLMNEHPTSEAQHAWKTIQQTMIMNKLHEELITSLNISEPIYMGYGSCNPDLLVITQKSRECSIETSDFLSLISPGLWTSNVFYTGRYKHQNPSKLNEDKFNEILDAQIKILKPKVILAFGPLLSDDLHVLSEHLHTTYIQTFSVYDFVMATQAHDDSKVHNIKAQIWDDLKQIRGYFYELNELTP